MSSETSVRAAIVVVLTVLVVVGPVVAGGADGSGALTGGVSIESAVTTTTDHGDSDGKDETATATPSPTATVTATPSPTATATPSLTETETPEQTDTPQEEDEDEDDLLTTDEDDLLTADEDEEDRDDDDESEDDEDDWLEATGEDTPTSVNVTVEGAVAGRPALVNVSSAPAGEEEGESARDVETDRLAVTISKDTSFDLNVTTAETLPADAPRFDRSDETKGVGFIRVNHTVSDEYIDGVNFTFRVSKRRVAAAASSPDHLALYRYHDGEWTELETRAVGETDANYVFEATSPGLSDFVVGAKRPSFQVSYTEATPSVVDVRDDVDVRVRVQNVGGVDGTYVATLFVNDEAVEEQRVTVAKNGTRQITFERTFGEGGTYAVAVNEIDVGVVRVGTDADASADVEAAVAGPPTGTSESAEVETPGFGLSAALVALLSVGAVLRRRVRRE